MYNLPLLQTPHRLRIRSMLEHFHKGEKMAAAMDIDDSELGEVSGNGSDKSGKKRFEVKKVIIRITFIGIVCVKLDSIDQNVSCSKNSSETHRFIGNDTIAECEYMFTDKYKLLKTGCTMIIRAPRELQLSHSSPGLERVFYPKVWHCTQIKQM